ncbi:MAG: phosphoenolpyruvate carboxylase [Actinomycetota bacterium]|nr:phosphoenolpyruvate carboxylase [Actinomycetota bacterium]
MTARSAATTGRRERPLPDPLRRDVRLLTTLLGDAIAESGGPELLADVERLRTATIALRTRPSPQRRRSVVALVAALDPARAEDVIRAFTAYFQLVNAAEEHHRVRTLRERAQGPGAGTIATALLEVTRAGADPATAISGLEIVPVLTAHPTEAKRRAVVEHLWRIAELLERHDDPRAPTEDALETERRLAEEIMGLWRTDPIRRHRPEPLDEVRAVMALFDQTIFRTIPLFYREVDRAIDPVGCGARAPAFKPFLRWNTWVGGDRDGNPSVTSEVTLAAVEVQTDHVLRGLERAARRIARSLSVSDRDVPPNRPLRASLARDAADLPAVAADLDRKLPDAPHRRKLVLAAERLAATRAGRGSRAAYPSATAFLSDLAVLQRSLNEGGAPRLAFGEVQHLAWQAETFGFHLASMEVRQHASALSEAIAELAPEASGDARALDRLARRARAATDRPRARSSSTREVLATFFAIERIQRRFGEEACSRVIVSFTRGPADLAAVHALARLASPDVPPTIQAVPLFESRHELATAPAILDAWLALPGARRRLGRNDRRLEVMVGYSDSAKEVGVLAANLELYRTQQALTAWAKDRDITLTTFHGRGGALGRGGGPANRAILGQPPGSVAGHFKATEQGEVAFARYGNQTIARHHLDQLTNAVIRASVNPDRPDPAEPFADEIETMATASADAYQRLVLGPGFVPFFRRVTPIEQIGTLPIASRPVARSAREIDELEDLRAIPWVFAWAQSRVNLPGWFGLGAGLDAVASRRGGPGKLRRMFRDWPFFTAFIENAELSLAKADLDIAELYLERGQRPDLTVVIRDELVRTTDLVLSTTGHVRLLDCRPSLQRAIELRNPYVDALSFLQLRSLASRPSATSERLVRATISGVAAGLQNTG